MGNVEFLQELQAQPTCADVSRVLSRQASALGFPTHVIAPMPSEKFPVHEGFFLVQNWPEAWTKAYEDEGFAEFDPTPRAASVMNGPFTLDDMYNGVAGFTPDPRSERMLKLAGELGRRRGLIVPIFGPHGYRAIVCFMGDGPGPDTHTQSLLHIWAIYAHDRVRELSVDNHAPSNVLSEREIEVLRAARDGLSDEESAEKLGISVRTVRFHFTNVRAKLNVKTRAQIFAYVSSMGILKG